MSAAMREPRRKKAKREVPPDGRARALARILARRVAARPGVEAFRREVLRGRLVRPENLPAWIERKAHEDGEPAAFYVIPLDDEGGRPINAPDLDRPRAETYDERRRLEFPGGDVKIAAYGTLDRLWQVSSQLRADFGCDQTTAVAFVVCGVTPELPLARINTVERGWSVLSSPGFAALAESSVPGLARVVLDLDPRLDPYEVKEIYRRERRRVRGQTRSTLEDRTAELAVFVDEANDGRAWADAYAAWNEARPDWAYPNVAAFRRAARDAYARVVGVKLDWRSRPGRRRRRSGDGKATGKR